MAIEEGKEQEIEWSDENIKVWWAFTNLCVANVSWEHEIAGLRMRSVCLSKDIQMVHENVKGEK